MGTFNIYKKRDGQSFNLATYIYATDFNEAKKMFALMMTDDNHSKSNNIVWLDKEQDGVNETGWYDFNGGVPTYNEETEKYDADEAADYLFCSEESINNGFDYWNEDVYTWELREPLDFIEIFDLEEFENEKDDFEWFMMYEGYRYFLYNGEFSPIAEQEGLGRYSPMMDEFMGGGVDDNWIYELLTIN